MSNDTPTVAATPATLENHLTFIGHSRRRISTACSDLFAQFVRMGFIHQPDNEDTGPAKPTPERTMLEEFSNEAAQLEGLATSIEQVAATLAQQYRRGQPVTASA